MKEKTKDIAAKGICTCHQSSAVKDLRTVELKHGLKTPPLNDDFDSFAAVEEEIEAEIRMICAFDFHAQMAQTAQRARDQSELCYKGIKRVLFIVRRHLEAAYLKGFDVGGQTKGGTERIVYERGREEGFKEAKQEHDECAETLTAMADEMFEKGKASGRIAGLKEARELVPGENRLQRDAEIAMGWNSCRERTINAINEILK